MNECNCDIKSESKARRSLKYLSAITLIVLPKCFACFAMAGAAITVCGLPGADVAGTGADPLGLWIMGGMVLLIALFQWRRNRTGLWFTLAGAVLLIVSQYAPQPLLWYYLGTTVIVTGLLWRKIRAWMNTPLTKVESV